MLTSFLQPPTLLLIDIQKGLDQWSYYGGNRNNTGAESNMTKILQFWRSNNWPLYHVKHNSTSIDSPLKPGQQGNEIKDEVAPIEGEEVIEKSVNSAFIGTDLLEKLNESNTKELVIIGLTTDHCVSTTTRMAGNYGFDVKLIGDATATFDKMSPSGKKYSAEDVHDVELATLHEEFCTVCTTEELLSNLEETRFWTERYEKAKTGWDIGYPSTPIKEYVDQVEDKSLKILIPGAGNAYEAEYLFDQGFENLYILDISSYPLTAFKDRVSEFPDDRLIQGNFFSHQGQYDLIIEQTFFCSFPPTEKNRSDYAKKMASLLKPKGKLVGLWFDKTLLEGNMDKRPFGGTKEEYLNYLTDYFDVKSFESCYNSIKPRMGNELFGIFVKK